jgi:hypothetical protein
MLRNSAHLYRRGTDTDLQKTHHVIAFQPVHWPSGWTYQKHMSRDFWTLLCDVIAHAQTGLTQIKLFGCIVGRVLRALSGNGCKCHNIICSTRFIHLDLIILIILYLPKSTSYEAPHYAFFSNLLSLHLSLVFFVGYFFKSKKFKKNVFILSKSIIYDMKYYWHFVSAPHTHCIDGWLGLRAGLDEVERRKFLTISGLELGPSVFQHIASRYTDCAIGE